MWHDLSLLLLTFTGGLADVDTLGLVLRCFICVFDDYGRLFPVAWHRRCGKLVLKFEVFWHVLVLPSFALITMTSFASRRGVLIIRPSTWLLNPQRLKLLLLGLKLMIQALQQLPLIILVLPLLLVRELQIVHIRFLVRRRRPLHQFALIDLRHLH